MKKSEMFDEMKACYDEYIDDYGVLYVLEKILYRQECKGMLPPTVELSAGGELISTKELLDYSEIDYECKWEPENE